MAGIGLRGGGHLLLVLRAETVEAEGVFFLKADYPDGQMATDLQQLGLVGVAGVVDEAIAAFGVLGEVDRVGTVLLLDFFDHQFSHVCIVEPSRVAVELVGEFESTGGLEV